MRAIVTETDGVEKKSIIWETDLLKNNDDTTNEIASKLSKANKHGVVELFEIQFCYDNIDEGYFAPVIFDVETEPKELVLLETYLESANYKNAIKTLSNFRDGLVVKLERVL